MAGYRVLAAVTGWALVSACGQTNNNGSGGGGSTAEAASGASNAVDNAPPKANGGSAGGEVDAHGGNVASAGAPVAGSNADGDDTGGSNAGGDGASSGSTFGGRGATDGAPASRDQVWKSQACGKAYAGAIGKKITIGTTGTKSPDCSAKMINGDPRCGAWGQASSTWQKEPLPRDYWVYLPPDYDYDYDYPLVLEAPGCGGTGGGIYDLAEVAKNVIRIGLSPADINVGHGTNPGQHCFDDKEGDDSLDWVFYETLYDALNTQLCFDRNRVFAVGDSSGAWFANELGCKYAGDTHGRPIRGIVSSEGSLPAVPQYAPKCTAAALPGVWVNSTTGDGSGVDAARWFPVARAMPLAGCAAKSYDTATLVDYPISGGQKDDACKQISGCDAANPLVTCVLPGPYRVPHIALVEAAVATLIQSQAPR